MSQDSPSEAELHKDSSPPLVQPLSANPDPCQDVPSGPAGPVPSLELEPPLHPETLSMPHPVEDTVRQDTTTKTDTSEPAAEGQVTECNQSVSLEPDAEAAEEDEQVCGWISSIPIDVLHTQTPACRLADKRQNMCSILHM